MRDYPPPRLSPEQDQKRPKKGEGKAKAPWSLGHFAAWSLIVLSFAIYFAITPRERPPESTSYSSFKELVTQDEVRWVLIKGEVITGALQDSETNEPQTSSEASKGSAGAFAFTTIVPSLGDPGLLALLEEHGVEVRTQTDSRSFLQILVTGALPWIFFMVIIFFFLGRLLRRSAGEGGGPFGFRKSQAHRFQKSESEVRWANVAGLENAKAELKEVVEYLKDPSPFEVVGARLPRGILLVGPPGGGKTLLARATAGEADVPFFSISGSAFVEMFVGVGASRVRDLFENAKKEAPSIIFIDEIDSIGRVRGTGLGGGHDEREQTLNQILAEMDGFTSNESVIVLAATNRPDVLDPALIRPGRFDRQITLDLPHRQARLAILNIHVRNVPLARGVNLEKLAAKTVGFSGADLSNLINEAALAAVRDKRGEVTEVDLERSYDRVLMGGEREERILPDERKVIAFHEAGHALLAHLLPEADPLEKVTILPRGRALGATQQMPAEDRHNYSRRYLLGRITILLGGRAAEKIVFDDVTSGAEDDIKKATQLARRMVCQWGMSDQVGPVHYPVGEEHPFLGREMAAPRNFSEDTARGIDQEVQSLVGEMENRATNHLHHHRSLLNRLAMELLEKETLGAAAIEALLGEHPGIRPRLDLPRIKDAGGLESFRVSDDTSADDLNKVQEPTGNLDEEYDLEAKLEKAP